MPDTPLKTGEQLADEIHVFEGSRETNMQSCISVIHDRLSALESHDHSELVGSINALVERVKIIDKNVEEDWKRFEYVREFLFCGKCHGSGSIWTGQRIETCSDCEGKAYINVADLLKRVKAVDERTDKIWARHPALWCYDPVQSGESKQVLSHSTTDRDVKTVTYETAPQKREWIRVPKYTEECWVFYPNGDICHGHVDELCNGYTHIMPYVEGEPAPEAPQKVGE